MKQDSLILPMAKKRKYLVMKLNVFTTKIDEKRKEEVAAAEEKDSPSYTHWALNKICLSSGTC